MTRKSQRLSSGSAATPKHKRVASNSVPTSPEQTRSKKQKATPTKSEYFASHDDPVDTAEDDAFNAEDSSINEEEASDFDAESELPSSDAGEDDDYGSESDNGPKKRKSTLSKKGGTASATVRMKESELLKPGVKTGLGPGTKVVIKKPKARPAGKTPYEDDTIHPNTLLFLMDLKANNERQWLKMHDAEFRQAERDWHSFVAKLTERLIEIDDTIPELPVKDVIFRIYRDVRFTSDPTPYKPHFSAAWSRAGRKGSYAHYYVQIAPGSQSFVGGGLWSPEAAPITAMRRDIDRHPRKIKDVLLGDGLRKEFLGNVNKNDGKAVKAFVSNNAAKALKTKPKGYNAEHPDIDLLRLRNYTIGRKLTESEVVGTQGLDRITDLLSKMRPFITYLNSVVMPDEDEDESEDVEDADEDAEEDIGGSSDDAEASD